MFKILSTCKGGGYMYCRTEPPHPKRNSKGLYPLHRVKTENKIGRLLDKNEVVHHKDGDKTNDRDENLELMARSIHAKSHAKTVEPIKCVCPICKKGFKERPNFYRARVKRSKSGKIFCSLRCSRKHQLL